MMDPKEPRYAIRPARPEDLNAIARLIRELADYEKLASECIFDEKLLGEHLFGERPYAEVLIAEDGGNAVGYALFFHNFSTFLARPGIYLEDLFVQPKHRGRGIGTALLRRVFAVARDRSCGRVEWSVLDWNTPSIDFYQKVFGAQPNQGWTVYRVTADRFNAIAGDRESP